ncbi:hypothetical protein MAR_017845 [Mya arenaria]|uniref:Uncharacterized protein n=1 Tax=Mya arenaria TaxID=6604 RepID=A0ABY7EGC2_MYAAR|nr:hypothetical protein MAR_017845 [Mya arenaria]
MAEAAFRSAPDVPELPTSAVPRGKFIVSTVKEEKICFGRQVKIPVGMSIADFNDKVVAKFQRQVYWAVPLINGTPEFFPDLGYQLKIKQLEEQNRYLLTAIGDVADGYSVALQNCKTSSFYFENVAYQSLCCLLVIRRRSLHIDATMFKGRHIRTKDVQGRYTAISLFVPDTLDNLKWSIVLKDLEETDVEFGDERYEWFFNFNYGKSMCVDV